MIHFYSTSCYTIGELDNTAEEEKHEKYYLTDTAFIQLIVRCYRLVILFHMDGSSKS